MFRVSRRTLLRLPGPVRSGPAVGGDRPGESTAGGTGSVGPVLPGRRRVPVPGNLHPRVPARPGAVRWAPNRNAGGRAALRQPALLDLAGVAGGTARGGRADREPV